jgi:hypothetical protein
MHVATVRLLLNSLPKMWMESFPIVCTFLFADAMNYTHSVPDIPKLVLYFQKVLGVFGFIILDE